MNTINKQEYKSALLGTIGKTPIIKIGKIYAKLEAYNPTGSVKDRMAAYMISQAEKRGELSPGQTIIELTTGNTGIGFAMISAIKGYKFIAMMPESMSRERQAMMKAFGAEIVLTPADEDMAQAVKRFEEYAKKHPDAWLPRQFENPDNIEAHRLGLGKEVVEQLPEVNAFVAGVGTGGTLLGVAKALKEHNPNVKIIAVEPSESAVLSGSKSGMHQIQGIGEGFIPKIVQDNIELIDEVIAVSSDEAMEKSKHLAKEHGLMVGISSGANMVAAEKLTSKFKTVATVLPDRGERYLSNNLYR